MVELKQAVKTYKDFQLSVDMNIPEGNITGIVGRNGAGKSTVLKAILGLINLDEGQVNVFGDDIKKIKPKDKAKLGVALAEGGFCVNFTVKDICKVLKNTYDDFDANAFMEECRKLDLPFDKKLSEFSTGMKAKIKVLIAISHNAKLLVLDEPTAGLDVVARNEVLDMLRVYMERKPDASILISSHISSDLEGICDDIYMIKDGKIIIHEDTDIILSKYAVLKVSSVVYDKLDKTYILKSKKQDYGFVCLTNEKQFYLENYPEIIIENGNIDDLIIMMTEGE